MEIKSIRDKPYTKGELTKDILKGLAIGGMIVAVFAMPGLAQVLTMFGADNAKDRYRVRRTMQELANKKMIRIYRKEGKDVVEITEKGKKKILGYKFDDIRLERPKKWDGYWRIVIFDIPEKHRVARSALSRKLKEIELYQLQKSVYLCPFNCKDEVDFIGEFFGVRKYIRFLIVKELDVKDEDYFKQYYNL